MNHERAVRAMETLEDVFTDEGDAGVIAELSSDGQRAYVPGCTCPGCDPKPESAPAETPDDAWHRRYRAHLGRLLGKGFNLMEACCNAGYLASRGIEPTADTTEGEECPQGHKIVLTEGGTCAECEQPSDTAESAELAPADSRQWIEVGRQATQKRAAWNLRQVLARATHDNITDSRVRELPEADRWDNRYRFVYEITRDPKPEPAPAVTPLGRAREAIRNGDTASSEGVQRVQDCIETVRSMLALVSDPDQYVERNMLRAVIRELGGEV